MPAREDRLKPEGRGGRPGGPETALMEAINTDRAGTPSKPADETVRLSCGLHGKGAVCRGGGRGGRRRLQRCPLGQRRQRNEDTWPPRWEGRLLQFWQFGFSQAPGAFRAALAWGGGLLHTYLGHGDYIWGRDRERPCAHADMGGGGKEGLKVSDGPTPHVPHMKTSQLGSYWQRWTN